MKIAIDLDNTITTYPAFFRALTMAMKGGHEIHIVTNRDPARRDETQAELGQLGIAFHHLAITAQKAAYILAHGIEVFFEDTDEYFLELPEHVAVLKTREPGNFNFETRRWVYGDRTGERVGRKPG